MRCCYEEDSADEEQCGEECDVDVEQLAWEEEMDGWKDEEPEDRVWEQPEAEGEKATEGDWEETEDGGWEEDNSLHQELEEERRVLPQRRTVITITVYLSPVKEPAEPPVMAEAASAETTSAPPPPAPETGSSSKPPQKTFCQRLRKFWRKFRNPFTSCFRA